WIVVETDPMTVVMKKYETDELYFCSSLEDAFNRTDGKIDITFTSGAIQYTRDPYKTINDLLNLNSSIIIFNRVSFSLEEYDIISIQTSLLSWHGLQMPKPKGFREKVIKYPHTNIQKKKFEELIFDKYKLLYTFE